MSTFVFNFSKRFAPLVAAGRKTQTVRQYRKDDRIPRAGDKLKAYCGLRTNKTKPLCFGVVTNCRDVQIDLLIGRFPMVILGCDRLGPADVDRFAKADGFKTAREFVEFFQKTYNGLDWFKGFCVEWRPMATFPRSAPLKELA